MFLKINKKTAHTPNGRRKAYLCDMENEMIEFCAQFVDEVNKSLPEPITKDEYIARMKQFFPQLKRWKK